MDLLTSNSPLFGSIVLEQFKLPAVTVLRLGSMLRAAH